MLTCENKYLAVLTLWGYLADIYLFIYCAYCTVWFLCILSVCVWMWVYCLRPVSLVIVLIFIQADQLIGTGLVSQQAQVL